MAGQFLDATSAASVRSTCRYGHAIAEASADIRSGFAFHTTVLTRERRLETAWYCMDYACRWVVPLLARALVSPTVFILNQMWIPVSGQHIVQFSVGNAKCGGKLHMNGETLLLQPCGGSVACAVDANPVWKNAIEAMNPAFRGRGTTIDFSLTIGTSGRVLLQMVPGTLHTEVGTLSVSVHMSRGSEMIGMYGKLPVELVRQYVLLS